MQNSRNVSSLVHSLVALSWRCLCAPYFLREKARKKRSRSLRWCRLDSTSFDTHIVARLLSQSWVTRPQSRNYFHDGNNGILHFAQQHWWEYNWPAGGNYRVCTPLKRGLVVALCPVSLPNMYSLPDSANSGVSKRCQDASLRPLYYLGGKHMQIGPQNAVQKNGKWGKNARNAKYILKQHFPISDAQKYFVIHSW